MIIMKVYSHQLTEDFHVADNAFTQSCSLTNAIPGVNIADYDKLYYTPFSPKWCFCFEGNLTN
jgi:hypothetical protein